MAIVIKVFFLTVSALFPLVDPLSGSPIFLALPREYAPDTRKILSQRIAIDSFFLLVGSYFIGAHVLNFFGVSLPLVQVGGAWSWLPWVGKMLMDREAAPTVRQKDVQPADILGRAFYPLTLPLTVGPGSISVAVTLGANATHHYGLHVSVVVASLIAMCLIAVSILLCYWFADRLAKVIGKTSDDSNSPAYLVSIAVHWSPDPVEWNQRAPIVPPLQRITRCRTTQQAITVSADHPFRKIARYR